MKIIKHRDYTPKDIGDPHDLFVELLRRIEDLPYMVGSGTALGLYRDGKLIETDTDIDIIFTVDLANEIARRFHDWPQIVTVAHQDRIQQLAYYPQDTIVDFHFYRPSAVPGLYECNHQNGTLVFELGGVMGTIQTKYGQVNIPPNIEVMLAEEYGPDWRTPIHRKKPEFKYKRGVLFGVFDPLHYGHIRLFRACRAKCDELFVVVRSDDHIREIKSREPFQSQNVRAEDVATVIGRDHTMLDHGSTGWAAFERWVTKLGADVFFASVENEGKIHLPVQVIYMDRTPGISSSTLRGAIK